jgi:Protein of unknown function (DUF3179)
VWKRTVNGQALHFHLAGINNQNFLMRDEETRTWWQQITGKAVFGPLKGRQLDAVLSDELSFGLWKQENPGGQVLAPVEKYAKQYESDWEPEVQKLPVVISFPGTGLQSRDVLVGIEIAGLSRAYPLKTLLAESPVQDRLGGSPLLLLVGPDKKSVRAFVSRIGGSDLEFFRDTTSPMATRAEEKTGLPQTQAPNVAAFSHDWTLLDAEGSQWNFQGCAVAGPRFGACLEPVYAIKDFWFDWRNYHPNTTVYQR